MRQKVETLPLGGHYRLCGRTLGAPLGTSSCTLVPWMLFWQEKVIFYLNIKIRKGVSDHWWNKNDCGGQPCGHIGCLLVLCPITYFVFICISGFFSLLVL